MYFMRIYLAHASSFDFQNELYNPLKKSLVFTQHTFILPHDEGKKTISSKEIIASCDLVIAEVSFPSTGLGIELGWADDLKKSIVGIYREGVVYSSALNVLTDTFFSYHMSENFEKIFEHIVTTKSV